MKATSNGYHNRATSLNDSLTSSNKSCPADDEADVDDGYVSQDFQLQSTSNRRFSTKQIQLTEQNSGIEEEEGDEEFGMQDNEYNNEADALQSTSNRSNKTSKSHWRQSFFGRGNSSQNESDRDCELDTSDDEIQIFSSSRIVGPSMRDTLASALLRLQVSVEEGNQKVEKLEEKVARLDATTTKIEAHHRNMARRQFSLINTLSSPVKLAELFVDNLTPITYFAWPIAVFFALRALERRSNTLTSQYSRN